MNRWLKPQTLLGRTIQALMLAFLLFALFSASLLQLTLVQPHTRQAADDLAALLFLSAQIWVELPPFTRADYERELRERHDLRILETEAAHPARSNSHSYLHYLEAALTRHLGQTVHIHRHPDHAGWLWADFPMADRVMRIGFRENRLQTRLLLVLPFLAALGLFVAFAMSILLVRRITRPLNIIAEATRRIGDGDFSSDIPETGPQEIASLARKLNRMESRIGQLLENRTTLLAGISHDLRTPLARMRLELELLQRAESKDLVEGLNNDITEMERLISQTLLLARSLGNEEARQVDLCDLLAGLAQDHGKSGADISLVTQGRCVCIVKADALKRVVGNLIENAVAYAGKKPIVIDCAGTGDAIAIKVIDRGPGIPQSEHESVFQPFHRLESSRNKETGGSGLGLAIVRQLCNANGWPIELSSPPEGGTVFTVRLPARNASAP